MAEINGGLSASMEILLGEILNNQRDTKRAVEELRNMVATKDELDNATGRIAALESGRALSVDLATLKVAVEANAAAINAIGQTIAAGKIPGWVLHIITGVVTMVVAGAVLEFLQIRGTIHLL